MNHHVDDKRSQAVRLARKNKKQLEREEKQAQIDREAAMDHLELLNRSKDSDEKKDQEEVLLERKDLDMQNFYVAEMRQPKWQEVQKSPEKSKPCEFFNRTYLPNG